MPRRWITLSYRRQRAVLTDMLPFETPPTFSNRGLFNFLAKHEIEVHDGVVHWIKKPKDIHSTVRLLFNIENSTKSEEVEFDHWGRKGKKISLKLPHRRPYTIPFDFRIAHKKDARVLSVVHPRHQVEMANLYADQSSLILYYSSLSHFSIRRPVSVSKYSYFKDRTHDQNVASAPGTIEEEDKEYEQLGSYFVYKKYSNINKFFESYKYHRCEKKYDAMAQIDITRCFDSIYTHSLSWAILGKAQTKFNLNESTKGIQGKFDSLMQNLNHSETNGIVIGPEFSRIFAEMILQSIDEELRKCLLEKEQLKHRVHYEIFRYVDDYFIFFNDVTTLEKIKTHLEVALRSKKLNLNAAKEKIYSKPIITEITIAKKQVSTLFNLEIAPALGSDKVSIEKKMDGQSFICRIDANKLITAYKSILKQSNVEYADLLNFTFAMIENKVENLREIYFESFNCPTRINAQ